MIDRTTRVLVVAAHPDDEVLGAGGLLAAHHVRGGTSTILIVGERISLRHHGVGLIEAQAVVRASAATLGVEDVRYGGLPAHGLLLAEAAQPTIVRAISDVMDDVNAQVVVTHHPGDIHADHRIVSGAVEYLSKNMGRSSIQTLLFMEVPSSTEQVTRAADAFFPTVFVDIASTLETKVAALAHYGHELTDGTHPRSGDGLRSLATWRGYQGGLHRAEAYQLARTVLQA